MAENNLPNPAFVACFPLQEYFVDKDTGAPLSGGVVTFYSDVNRSVLKPIYQQVQLPNNTYQFVELPNPLTLSIVGTPSDDNGNDIIPFLYPFTGLPTDAIMGGIELYYITVYAANPPVGSGALQFTREAWPPNVENEDEIQISPLSQNELLNSQFVEVNFIDVPAGSPFTFSVSGANVSTQIAPYWYVLTSGTGSVTINQVAITDTLAPTNPPYALGITSTGISQLILYQRISASPRLLARGNVSGMFVAADENGLQTALQLMYTPSNGSNYQIANGTTTSNGLFSVITGTVSINNIISTDAAPAGYVDIQLIIPVGSHVQVSSFQIVGVSNPSIVATFEEQSTPIQKNGLFSYYEEPLKFKPIESYLTGWDFVMNPAQLVGSTVSATSATNAYVWDQTILYQSNPSKIGVQRSTSGGISLASSDVTGATQAALIQYIGNVNVWDVLNNPLSINISGNSSGAALTCNVSIWYTTNGNVPILPLGFINSLDANGHPSSVVGGWTELTRNVPWNANFQLTSTAQDIGFNGWNTTPFVNPTSITFVAVVIGTAAIPNMGGLTLNSVSLVPGNIPTRPAFKTYEETLTDCEFYYEKSYLPSVIPGTVDDLGSLVAYQITNFVSPITLFATPFNLSYRTVKRVSTPNIHLYSPATLNAIDFVSAQIYSAGVLTTMDVATTNWTIAAVNSKNAYYKATAVGAIYTTTGTSGSNNSGAINFHYVIDARAGVV